MGICDCPEVQGGVDSFCILLDGVDKGLCAYIHNQTLTTMLITIIPPLAIVGAGPAICCSSDSKVCWTPVMFCRALISSVNTLGDFLT